MLRLQKPVLLCPMLRLVLALSPELRLLVAHLPQILITALGFALWVTARAVTAPLSLACCGYSAPEQRRWLHGGWRGQGRGSWQRGRMGRATASKLTSVKPRAAAPAEPLADNRLSHRAVSSQHLLPRSVQGSNRCRGR